ncbi:MAG TPA: carboxypeptidase-like regulatory domain-containing protein [Cyclobacteriaceae bacterium]|nr:carboxypeptidase-like regulatory domain-containing protein [Cyclobacteriaceae bacterium]
MIFLVIAACTLELRAQGGQLRIIQFSGIVIQPDSSGGVIGAHVYVPKAGRGTTTNQYGYFSLPVLANDSIVISSVGYRKYTFIVPGNQGDRITAIISLQQDTTYLPEIEIFPYPTEELLKEAILAMHLPNQEDMDAISQNLNEKLMAEMFRTMPMDAGMNYRYYMNQRVQYINDGYGPRYNPLLNPFAWAEFFKSLKRGDLKRK